MQNSQRGVVIDCARQSIPTIEFPTDNFMQALIVTRYGSPDVLRIAEVETPVPSENEILIRVHATTVTTADTMMRRADPFIARFFLGFSKPKKPIPGTGFSGVVEAVGANVSNFQPGDAVFGETGVEFSANAEYISLAEDHLLLPKPAGLSHVEAAPICDGPLTAKNFLSRLATLQQGQTILINGAAGSIGTAAVQLAKHAGAEVTGVCSGRNTDFVTSLGADHVIDYTQRDFTTTGATYDVIFDTVGKSSYGRCKRALAPDGAYISPVLSLPLLGQMLWTAKFSRKKAKFDATGLLPVPEQRTLLDEILPLYASGEMRTIIDRTYSLQEAVEAHRYVDTGHKRGSVVLELVPETAL